MGNKMTFKELVDFAGKHFSTLYHPSLSSFSQEELIGFLAGRVSMLDCGNGDLARTPTETILLACREVVAENPG
jgi:hypothetical protein